MKYPVITTGNAYEDMAALDVNRDGAVDIVASFDATLSGTYSLVWFENPRGHGGDPAVDPWVMHTIGPGQGENNIAIADLDGDGLPDIATSSDIYFQNSPDSWTDVPLSNAFRGVALLDIGAGNGAVNIVSTGPTAPYNAVWFENPRETGGNARSGAWKMHTIGSGYACNANTCPDGPDVAVYAAADLNGDGRMDIIEGQSEGPATGAPPPGGLVWFEAPADRRSGTWIKHTIDSSFIYAHKISLADMDKNGTIDVVTAEQNQSLLRRVSVFYNDGQGNFSQQVLSNVEGHNQALGSVTGNGSLDILNSGHGFFGAPHPLQIFFNPY